MSDNGAGHAGGIADVQKLGVNGLGGGIRGRIRRGGSLSGGRGVVAQIQHAVGAGLGFLRLFAAAGDKSGQKQDRQDDTEHPAQSRV